MTTDPVSLEQRLRDVDEARKQADECAVEWIKRRVHGVVPRKIDDALTEACRKLVAAENRRERTLKRVGTDSS